MSLRWQAKLFAITALCGSVALTACSERLDSTAGCPTTCSGETSDIVNETFDAVTLDTTVPASLGIGTETRMLLAARGDTLDTRVIMRFDSLPSKVATSHTDTTQIPISYVDSAIINMHFDSLGGKILTPVTISAYDVSGAGDDTSVAALAPLFTSGNLVGSRTFGAGQVVDTVGIPISSSFLLGLIQAGKPLRLGFRISSSTSVMVRAYAVESGNPESLTFRASTDTLLPYLTVLPLSRVPVDNRSVAASLSDFTLIVIGTPSAPAGFLGVGGVPAQRSYLLFNIPARILDSSIVVRATLILTQQGSAAPDGSDTMYVQPQLVLATPLISDPVKAAQVIAPTSFPFDTARVFPAQGGTQEVEIAPAFRVWSLSADSLLPRAIVLMSGQEAISPQQALFYSSSASPSLRPQLRISYTPRTRIGTP